LELKHAAAAAAITTTNEKRNNIVFVLLPTAPCALVILIDLLFFAPLPFSLLFRRYIYISHARNDVALSMVFALFSADSS